MTDFVPPYRGEGERGEKGDQGQHGQDGKPGKTGERGPSSRRVLIGYLVLSAFVILSFFRAHQIDTRHCEYAKVNRIAIRGAITAGDPTKLKKGDPGYEYWATHPEEAQAARNKIYAPDGSLARFPPIKC